MSDSNLTTIVTHFAIEGTVTDVAPLGGGLINKTYRVTTAPQSAPDYVLQRINTSVFSDVDLLQRNIETVTAHIRSKLLADGVKDIDRRVLRFVPSDMGGTWWRDEAGEYWRLMVFIPDAYTYDLVNPDYSRCAGRAFGAFESMLSDLKTPLGETIPHFHDMPFRLHQLDDAIHADAVNRLHEVQDIVDEIRRRATYMCQAEDLHRQGLLPKRICHCDTKVNNMMFDAQGEVLCIIDLDTVMPGFIFSDYGDFLRTAANATTEDDADLSHVGFRHDIYRAFTEGYLQGAADFITPLEKELLPYATALFPYMQCVRFLTDYLNGDTYYRTLYPTHNLVRTRNQLRLLTCVEHELELNTAAR